MSAAWLAAAVHPSLLVQLTSDDEAALGKGVAGEEALLQDEELLMRFTKH